MLTQLITRFLRFDARWRWGTDAKGRVLSPLYISGSWRIEEFLSLFSFRFQCCPGDDKGTSFWTGSGRQCRELPTPQ